MVHRGISSQTLLLDSDLQIKLTDFTQAIKLSENQPAHFSILGEHQSPEMIDGMGYSYDCDLWAFGCLIY